MIVTGRRPPAQCGCGCFRGRSDRRATPCELDQHCEHCDLPCEHWALCRENYNLHRDLSIARSAFCGCGPPTQSLSMKTLGCDDSQAAQFGPQMPPFQRGGACRDLRFECDVLRRENCTLRHELRCFEHGIYCGPEGFRGLRNWGCGTIGTLLGLALVGRCASSPTPSPALPTALDAVAAFRAANEDTVTFLLRYGDDFQPNVQTPPTFSGNPVITSKSTITVPPSTQQSSTFTTRSNAINNSPSFEVLELSVPFGYSTSKWVRLLRTASHSLHICGIVRAYIFSSLYKCN